MTRLTGWWKALQLRWAILLTLFMVLGFWLRLTGLIWGQAWFYFGQGDGIEAYSVAVDYGLGSPTAAYLGQPNFNHCSKLPGPLWTLFCYAGLRLWGSIEGVVILVILFNTAATGLIYLLARRTLGSDAALWAALFGASCPWAVYYSVGVYNPEVMCFLGALLFLALWQTSQVNRSRSVFWVPLLLLVMPQFHMSGLMLIPAVLVIFIICPAQLSYRWLLGGVLAGLALYVPYVRGELASGWVNTRGMFGGGDGYSWDGLKALSAPLSFLVNWAPRWTRSAAEYHELGRACFGFFGVFLAINVISALVAVCLVTGAAAEIRKVMTGFLASPRAAYARAPGVLFLAILFVVPLLVALASGKPFHTRYCLVLLPVELSLAAAATMHWLASKRVRRPFLVGLLLTTCANVWLMPAMYHAQGRRIENGTMLIPTFRKLETIYSALSAHAGPNSSILVKAVDATASFSFPEYARQDTALIQRFVEVREKENHSKLRRTTTSYRLCAEGQVTANDPAVAYAGNGIALIAVPPERGSSAGRLNSGNDSGRQ